MKDCNLIIKGKNDTEIARISVPFSSELASDLEIAQTLLSKNLKDVIEKLDENSKTELDLNQSLNVEQLSKEGTVLGNYNSKNIINYFESRGVNLDQRTTGLLEYVSTLVGDTKFILLNNRGLTNDSKNKVNGVLLRNNDVNPLIVLDGHDNKSLENTLLHELLHLAWNKTIEADKGLQDDLKNLLSDLKKDKDPEIKKLVASINRGGNKPTEIFAYAFSDNYSYNYIKENYPDILASFNNLMPVQEPVTSIDFDSLNNFSGKDIPSPKTYKESVEELIKILKKARGVVEKKDIELAEDGTMIYDTLIEQFEESLINPNDSLNKELDEDSLSNFKEMYASIIDKINKFSELEDRIESSDKDGSELEYSDELPYEKDKLAISEEQKLPRFIRNEQGYGYSNIGEAYDYLESKKDNIHDYWSIEKKVNSDFQLRQIKAGDVIRMNKLHYLKKGVAKELGLTDKEYPTMLSLNSIISQGEAITEAYKKSTDEVRTILQNNGIDDISDAKIKSLVNNHKKFKEDNEKYRYLEPNYISAGVFFNKNTNQYMTYVPIKFGKDAEPSSVLIPLTTDNIKYYRSLHDDFKTKYEYENGEIKLDKNGDPIIKEVLSDINTKDIAEGDINAAKASLEVYNSSKKDLKDLTKAEEKLLEVASIKNFTTKNGKSFISNSQYGLCFTGYAGDLEEQAMEASAGDIVRYQKGWKNKKPIIEFGFKVMNTAGGIMILDEAGKKKTISSGSILTVIFDKNNLNNNITQTVKDLNESLNVKLPAEKRKDYLKADDNMSIFPFFNKEIDRKELASNLKKGDIINVRFFKDGKPMEILAPIVHVTNKNVYFATKNEEYPIMSVDIEETSDDKWFKIKGEWKYGQMKNDKFIPSTRTKSYIVAAYQENNNKDLFDYLKDRMFQLKEAYDKGKKLIKLEGEYELQDLTSALIGSNFNMQVSVDPETGLVQMPLSKSSIDSEWDISDLSSSNYDEKLDALSDLIPGDLIKTTFYSEKLKKDIQYWAIFKGYTKNGNPTVVRINESSRAVGSSVNIDQVIEVGKRTLPIVSYIDTDGDKKFATLDNQSIEQLRAMEGVSNIHTISPGRQGKINALKNRLEQFVKEDRSAALFTEEEWNKNKKEINDLTFAIGDTEWGVKKFEVKPYVSKETGEIIYSGSAIEGFELNTDEPSKYKVEMYKKDDPSSRYFLRNIDFNKKFRKLYGVGKKDFDETSYSLTEGDLTTMEYTNQDGKKIYIEGVITKTNKNYIEMSYFKKNVNENGLTTYVPKSLTWFKSYDNIRITKAYVSSLSKNYKYKSDNNIEESNKNKKVSKPVTKSTTQKKKPSWTESINNLTKRVNKSKETEYIRKPYDPKEYVSLLTNRMNTLYGVNAIALGQDEFNELGTSLGHNLSDARACVIDGQIYINLDLASTSDVLHELTHILLPGLKAKNQEAYQIIINKIKNHPEYENVKKDYPNLSENDLAEEAFCTIFGEYFRKQMISKDEAAWLGGEFMQLTESIPSIVSEVFDSKDVNKSGYELMNMTIEDIMMSFGSALVTGDFQTSFNHGLMLENKSYVSKIYNQLIDSGNLTIIC